MHIKTCAVCLESKSISIHAWMGIEPDSHVGPTSSTQQQPPYAPQRKKYRWTLWVPGLSSRSASAWSFPRYMLKTLRKNLEFTVSMIRKLSMKQPLHQFYWILLHHPSIHPFIPGRIQWDLSFQLHWVNCSAHRIAPYYLMRIRTLRDATMTWIHCGKIYGWLT